MPPDLAQGALLAGLKVLVVEDEMLIAMDLEEMLERSGAQVLGPLATVAEALDLLGTERLDVALLDVNLKDGIVTRLAEALRSRSIPYVISTAYNGSDLVGLEALAHAPKIGKPAREQQLISALAKASNR
jgi:two-component system, response regulator PdtaR